MATCMICHFETMADDYALQGPSGRVVCVRCFSRETGNALRMGRFLRDQVNAILAVAEKPAPPAPYHFM